MPTKPRLTPIARAAQARDDQATQPRRRATRTPRVYPPFDQLPDNALVRRAQLCYDPKKPGVPVPLPFGPSSIHRKVNEGTFPAPIKLGPRTSVWRVGDVRAWLAEQQQGGKA
ncbi:hypothetical protein C6568_17370 [Melaminivora suipulveris]|uniref:Uncharacterized protein n=1 Tax=Melaminivora suipulveris TaxID=2109913 RepID=A0A2R3QHI9_9BURK|nr:hypothetical protein C6568_17370 [Melaminivora suipulveris]